MPRNIFSYAVRSTMDMGHFFAFGILALFCYRVLRAHLNQKNAYLAAIAFSAVLVLMIEAIQPWFGRTAAFGDIFTSYLGIITFISLLFVWHNPLKKKWQKWGHIALVIFIVVSVIAPAINAWYGILWRLQQGPNLGQFEHKVELQFWQANEVGRNAAQIMRSTDVAHDGQYSLKVMAGTTNWSGTTYNAEHANWQPYKTLSFYVYNPGDTLKLTVRIDDDGDTWMMSNRFNKSFHLQKGWQNISIPIEEIADGPKHRKMNMRAIQRVLFFISKKSKTRVFYLDDVTLFK